MRGKKVFFFLTCLVAISFFMIDKGWAQPRPGTRAPVITHAFAADKGYYGSIWKIFLEAEDPDGDMLKIAAVVDQSGYGTYPTDWIYLKPQYEKNFRGYLQWNTFSSKTSYLEEWTEITLMVSVFDKAGNVSNEAVFPFTFKRGTKSPDQLKPPAPFDDGKLQRLGYISIDLFDPTHMDGDGSGGGEN